MKLVDVLNAYCGGMVNIQLEEDAYHRADMKINSWIEPEYAIFSEIFKKDFLQREIYVMCITDGELCVSLCEEKKCPAT